MNLHKHSQTSLRFRSHLKSRQLGTELLEARRLMAADVAQTSVGDGEGIDGPAEVAGPHAGEQEGCDRAIKDQIASLEKLQLTGGDPATGEQTVDKIRNLAQEYFTCHYHEILPTDTSDMNEAKYKGVMKDLGSLVNDMEATLGRGSSQGIKATETILKISQEYYTDRFNDLKNTIDGDMTNDEIVGVIKDLSDLNADVLSMLGPGKLASNITETIVDVSGQIVISTPWSKPTDNTGGTEPGNSNSNGTGPDSPDNGNSEKTDDLDSVIEPGTGTGPGMGTGSGGGGTGHSADVGNQTTIYASDGVWTEEEVQAFLDSEDEWTEDEDVWSSFEDDGAGNGEGGGESGSGTEPSLGGGNGGGEGGGTGGGEGNGNDDDSDDDDSDDEDSDDEDSDDDDSGDSDEGESNEEEETEEEESENYAEPTGDPDGQAPPDHVGMREFIEEHRQNDEKADRNSEVNPDPNGDGGGEVPNWLQDRLPQLGKRPGSPGPDPVVDPGGEFPREQELFTFELIAADLANRGNIDYGPDGKPDNPVVGPIPAPPTTIGLAATTTGQRTSGKKIMQAPSAGSMQARPAVRALDVVDRAFAELGF